MKRFCDFLKEAESPSQIMIEMSIKLCSFYIVLWIIDYIPVESTGLSSGTSVSIACDRVKYLNGCKDLDSFDCRQESLRCILFRNPDVYILKSKYSERLSSLQIHLTEGFANAVAVSILPMV